MVTSRFRSANKNAGNSGKRQRLSATDHSSALEQKVINFFAEYTEQIAPIQPSTWLAETMTGAQIIDDLIDNQGYVRDKVCSSSLGIPLRELREILTTSKMERVRVRGFGNPYYLIPYPIQLILTKGQKKPAPSGTYDGDNLFNTLIEARLNLPAREFTFARLCDKYPGIYTSLVSAGGVALALTKTAEYLRRRGNPEDIQLAAKFDYGVLTRECQSEPSDFARMQESLLGPAAKRAKIGEVVVHHPVYLPLDDHIRSMVQAMTEFNLQQDLSNLLPYEKKQAEADITKTLVRLREQIFHVIHNPPEGIIVPKDMIRMSGSTPTFRADLHGLLATLVAKATQRMGYTLVKTPNNGYKAEKF
ncbi:TPA: hypothetical protein HA246_04525 [Candidatus Woesearchaeota archaeon]|nr:hypothetical protein [Candidatus Woesearchaeota archaeon]